MFVVSLGYTERTYLKNRKKNKNNGRKATICLFAISHAQKRILGYSEFTGVIKEGLRLLRPFKIASVRGSLALHISSVSGSVPYQVCHTLIWSLKGHRSTSVFLTSSPIWDRVGPANQPTNRPVHSGRGEATASTLFYWKRLCSLAFCLISFWMSLQD